MNIKSINIFLITSLLIIQLFVIGCGGGDSSDDAIEDSNDNAGEEITQTPLQAGEDNIDFDTITEQDIDQVIAELESQWEEDCDCIVGKIEAQDVDGDGTDDKWDTSFGQDEIEEGLYVQDDMSFELIESGLQGELTITFENKGDKDYLGYSYIVEIPKSFAETVDDIEFSVPPDKVIDPDPKVECTVDLSKSSVTELKFIAAIKVIDADPSVVIDGIIVDYAKLWCGKPFDFEERIRCVLRFANEWKASSLCDLLNESFLTIDDPKFDMRWYPKVFHTYIIAGRQVCRKLTGQSQNYLDIRLPETPLLAGQEIVFVAESKDDDVLQDCYYEWDFGDGTGLGIPFSDEATHLYEKDGTYQVKVDLFYRETDENPMISATTTVTIEGNQEKEEPKLDIDKCINLAQSCADDCNKVCEDTKAEYCKKYGYSGCALDVFCWCNACDIYDTKWCPQYPDYVGCAEGAKDKYKSCIEGCQSKREAGQDVSTCWQECNAEFDEGIVECKQEPCQDFCENEGFQNGEWANYTNEYGWDSCYCSDSE